jgi:hypothetical protein
MPAIRDTRDTELSATDQSVVALASAEARRNLLAKLHEVTTKDDGVLDGGDSDE